MRRKETGRHVGQVGCGGCEMHQPCLRSKHPVPQANMHTCFVMSLNLHPELLPSLNVHQFLLLAQR